MYVGWKLSDASRDELMTIFRPAYPDVIAHHITLEHGVNSDHPLPPEVEAGVMGFVRRDGVEALIVRINGSTARPDGGVFHITWSIDRSRGKKPVDSNAVIKEFGYDILVSVMPISVEPMIHS